MKLCDFSGLAVNYSKYRSGYCPSLRDAILAIAKTGDSNTRRVNLGAGTGIWTRMMAKKQGGSVSGVEPNLDMFKQGTIDSNWFPIIWYQAFAEDTGLEESQFDLVTMASNFHWVDFEKGLSEIIRILKPRG